MGSKPLANLPAAPPPFATLQQRGMQGFQDAQMAQNASLYDGSLATGAPRIQNTVLPNPQWEGFLQALQDQGVTKLGTSAATGVDDPTSKLQTPTKPGYIRTQQTGFFDAQDPQNLQRQALMAQLRAQDVNAGVQPSVPSAASAWTRGVQRAR
jgi:hypothetical protein